MENPEFPYIIVYGSLAMFVLTSGIILLMFAYQRRQQVLYQRYQDKLKEQQEVMLKTAIKTGEEMRKKIGMDLHDQIGNDLSALKLSIYPLLDDSSEKHKSIKSQLGNTLENVRQISHFTYPAVLTKGGLKRGIRNIKKMYENTHGINLTLNIINDFRYDSELEINTYRIIQELITNIVKHSKANYCDMEVELEPQDVTIKLENDGVEFDLFDFDNQMSNGMGIINLRARIAALKAKTNYKYEEGKNLIEIHIHQNND